MSSDAFDDDPRDLSDEERRQKHKEWIDQKKQILEESDVDFVQYMERGQEYETFDYEGRTIKKAREVWELRSTIHIDNIGNGVLTKVVQDGEVTSSIGNGYAYDVDVDIEEWLEHDDNLLHEEYDPSPNYDYPREMEIKFCATQI